MMSKILSSPYNTNNFTEDVAYNEDVDEFLNTYTYAPNEGAPTRYNDTDKDDDSNDRSKEPGTGNFGWSDSIADWDYGGRQMGGSQDNETSDATNHWIAEDEVDEGNSDYHDWYAEVTPPSSDRGPSYTFLHVVLSDSRSELERQVRRVKSRAGSGHDFARPRG